MANATKRPKKVYRVRKARLLRETNNLERLKCKLLERMHLYTVYIYINTDVQNTLNGIVVKTLQCWTLVWECGTSWISCMSDSCSLSPPSGLQIKMLGFGLPCNQRVVSHQKNSNIIHFYPCQ